MSNNTRDLITLPIKDRIERVLCSTFKGLHNAPKQHWDGMRCTINPHDGGHLATHDSDGLSRLVFAAHIYGIRAELAASGPRRVKIILTPRITRIGECFYVHPNLDDAVRLAKARAGV